MLNNLRPLTQEQRQGAREAACGAVTRAVGNKPTRVQFQGHSVSKYPRWMTLIITALLIALLIAVFIPSSMRLYHVGKKTFEESGAYKESTVARQLAGYSTVLSAEIGQVVFSLALATLGTTRSARRQLYTGMLLATLLALVGNVHVALPEVWKQPMGWLEAFLPPLLTFFIAYALKGQLLNAIEERHANELAYQDALATWRAATRDPEKHPRWNQFYANAIRDALLKRNSRRKTTLEAMSTEDWRAAVWRELQAESWFDVAQEQPVTARPMQPPAPALAGTGSGNGHHNGNGTH